MCSSRFTPVHILICVLIYDALENAVGHELAEGSRCTTTLDACILDINPSCFGSKGENTDKSCNGIHWIPGSQGDKGQPGEDRKGPSGPPGEQGEPGSCHCEGLSEIFPCKDAHPESDKEYVVLGPAFNKFAGYCGTNAREICIPEQNNPITMFDYANKTKPFWISDVGIDLENKYGINYEQLVWLRKYASYVRQTLRYHCDNSMPYDLYDVHKSLSLLTSNDKIIEPYPNDNSPFFYSVIEDKCQDSHRNPTGEAYTDIALISSVLDRLPIRDIRINDIRNVSQSFHIEHYQLCFALILYPVSDQSY